MTALPISFLATSYSVPQCGHTAFVETASCFSSACANFLSYDDAGDENALDADSRAADVAGPPEDKRLVVAPMTKPLPHTSQVV